MRGSEEQVNYVRAVYQRFPRNSTTQGECGNINATTNYLENFGEATETAFFQIAKS